MVTQLVPPCHLITHRGPEGQERTAATSSQGGGSRKAEAVVGCHLIASFKASKSHFWNDKSFCISQSLTLAGLPSPSCLGSHNLQAIWRESAKSLKGTMQGQLIQDYLNTGSKRKLKRKKTMFWLEVQFYGERKFEKNSVLLLFAKELLAIIPLGREQLVFDSLLTPSLQMQKYLPLRWENSPMEVITLQAPLCTEESFPDRRTRGFPDFSLIRMWSPQRKENGQLNA